MKDQKQDPILVFPTLIGQSMVEVTEEEKDLWFNLYLKNSDEEGKSMDFLGFSEIHNSPELDLFVHRVGIAVRHYLEHLSIEHVKLKINLVKTWFNVHKECQGQLHDHAEAHISFVYYPHINENVNREFEVYSYGAKRSNEPISNFYHHNATATTLLNARSVRLAVNEGLILVFPSDLGHKTVNPDNPQTPSGIEGFRTIAELKETRFCVAGDILLTRKDSERYERLLTPPDIWREI